MVSSKRMWNTKTVKLDCLWRNNIIFHLVPRTHWHKKLWEGEEKTKKHYIKIKSITAVLPFNVLTLTLTVLLKESLMQHREYTIFKTFISHHVCLCLHVLRFTQHSNFLGNMTLHITQSLLHQFPFDFISVYLFFKRSLKRQIKQISTQGNIIMLFVSSRSTFWHVFKLDKIVF